MELIRLTLWLRYARRGLRSCLVVLGINLSDYEFGQASRLEEARVLLARVSTCWKGEAISQACAVFKRQTLLSEASLVMPPAQRTKGRFLNLQPLCQWGRKLLSLLKETPELLSQSIQEKIAWLLPYQDMQTRCQTMNALLKILKNQGLSEQSAQQCRVVLQQSTANDFFKQAAETYLQQNLARLGQDPCRFRCSDSIESLFGKYKNQSRQAPGQVITDACLTMVNLTAKPLMEEIKQAMQETKMIDLQKWKKENYLKASSRKEENSSKVWGDFNNLNPYPPHRDETKVSQAGFVPYGRSAIRWQFHDEEVAIEVTTGRSINCFGLLSRANDFFYKTLEENLVVIHKVCFLDETKIDVEESQFKGDDMVSRFF